MIFLGICMLIVAWIFSPLSNNSYSPKAIAPKRRSFLSSSAPHVFIRFFPDIFRQKGSKEKRHNRSHKKKKQIPSFDVGNLVSEVATRLRSGQTHAHAWQETLQRAGFPSPLCTLDEHGRPRALIHLWNMYHSRQLRDIRQRRKERKEWGMKVTRESLRAIPGAIAVCILTHSTGAPAAEILDSCAYGISQAEVAESERAVALSGPRASARMIAALPLAGIVIGSLMGASPLNFLFFTSWGRVCLIGGIACELFGAAMVYQRVKRAEKKAL